MVDVNKSQHVYLRNTGDKMSDPLRIKQCEMCSGWLFTVVEHDSDHKFWRCSTCGNLTAHEEIIKPEELVAPDGLLLPEDLSEYETRAMMYPEPREIEGVIEMEANDEQ